GADVDAGEDRVPAALLGRREEQAHVKVPPCSRDAAAERVPWRPIGNRPGGRRPITNRPPRHAAARLHNGNDRARPYPPTLPPQAEGTSALCLVMSDHVGGGEPKG